MTIDIDQPDIVWDEIEKRYSAYLTLQKVRHWLGFFQNIEDAQKARTQQAFLFIQEFKNYQ